MTKGVFKWHCIQLKMEKTLAKFCCEKGLLSVISSMVGM